MNDHQHTSTPAPRARVPWSESETRELERRHSDGESLHSIAKAMGRSKQTIGRHAAKLDLRFDRSATLAATEANMVDAKARRLSLERRFLDEVDRALDRMWAPVEVGAFNAMGDYSRANVSEPTPQDRKAIAVAASSLLASATKLAELNSQSSADHARSQLGKLMVGISAYVDAEMRDEGVEA